MGKFGSHVFIVSLVLVFSTCVLSPNTNDGLVILSPNDGAVFAFNEAVKFVASAVTVPDDLTWHNEQGSIWGKGAEFTKVLIAGEYTVILKQNSQEVGSVSFTVLPMDFSPGSFVQYVQMLDSQIHILSPGHYIPGYVNLGSDAAQPTINIPKDRGAGAKDSFPALDVPPVRDPILTLPKGYEAPDQFIHALTRNLQDSSDYLVSQRDFFIPNLHDSQSDPTIITASAALQDNSVVLWVDEQTIIPTADIQSLFEKTHQILPRVETLFGIRGATNGDRKIHILFTPLVNQSSVAIGFFNPADLLPRNTQDWSSSYNPFSNECNLITLGVPQEESDSGSFSLSSLAATISHELSHLIRFQRKTRQVMLSGSQDVPYEEIFLDEGLAHLTETLLGYGVSGGNLNFAQHYLDSSAVYSFSGLSLNGQDDSAGRRGAMLLLLSWWFWKQGGLSVNEDGGFVDRGGIRFLQQLVDTQLTGWPGLESALNTSRSQIIKRFFEDSVLNIEKNDVPKDPFTHEPLGVQVHGGGISGFRAMEEAGLTSIAPMAIGYSGGIFASGYPEVFLGGSAAQRNRVQGHLHVYWFMIEP